MVFHPAGPSHPSHIDAFKAEILLHPEISLIASVAVQCCHSSEQIKQVWNKLVSEKYPRAMLETIRDVAQKYGFKLPLEEEKSWLDKIRMR